MNILLVLIPVTGLIVLVAVALFFWAANHQQFDDLDSPAVLPLMEDEPAPGPAGEPPAESSLPAGRTGPSAPADTTAAADEGRAQPHRVK